MKLKFIVLIIKSSIIGYLLLLSSTSLAQTNDSIDNWDNQLYFGNRYVWSSENWRYTGEFQVRLDNNIRSLNQYFFEGVATYMASENWEIVPDFRYSIYPDRSEYRPGLGAIYKVLWTKKETNQMAFQLKWQADIESTGIFKHGARFIVFYNRSIIEKKLGLSSGGGAFYRWSEAFNGVQFARAYLGLAYQFNDVHILSFNYFVGAENRKTHWEYIGGPFVTFIIKLDNDSKYEPAKYINF